jgi:hypothetical protein
MKNEDQEKRAEHLAEAALKRYADCEMRPGFETRLLATIAAERERRRSRKLMWIWLPVGALAVIAIAITLLTTRSTRQPNAPLIANHHRSANPPVTTQPPPDRATAPQAIVTSRANRPRATRNSTEQVIVAHAIQRDTAAPKRPQFPTPAPLSEQERLLLAYVRRTPQQEVQTVIAQREQFEKIGFGLSEEQEKSHQ